MNPLPLGMGSVNCKDDRPNNEKIKSNFDNAKYNELVGALCKYYDIVIQNGITPKKYSWKFDRAAICDKLFSTKTEKLIERKNVYENSLKDGFLPRLIGRGFSDQVNIPQDLHNKTIQIVLNDIKQKYGEDFANISFKGVEEDLLITIYNK